MVSEIDSRGEIPGALIPRSVLFGNPERAQARLSHDGARLAFLAPVDGVLNVWVGPASNPAAAQPVTKDDNRGIRQYFWAHTNDHVVYLQDKGGDENWRVYVVSLATGETKDLTPFEKVAARIEKVSHRFPSEILVLLNDRDEQLHDVYRISLETGARELVLENDDGFVGFVTDDDYRVRFADRMTPEGGSEYFERGDDGEWKPFLSVAMEDTLTTGPYGFDSTGTKLYMLDSRERDTGALVELDLSTGASRVLAEDSRADISNVLVHPTKYTVQAAAFNYERVEWKVLDPRVAADLENLAAVDDGEIEVVSRTLDDGAWIVAFTADDGPVRYYLFERASGEAKFLFANRSDLDELPLVKMHPIVVRARDGLDLVCYLSLPQFADPESTGRSSEPLPTIINVHGGPWARDVWGYDSQHQWLANRGYAVISVNYRGSTGFGKSFVNAGNLAWAREMHDDLLDVIDWSVKEGVSDPKRVAIMGGSYGGYAALVGLTVTPEVFACGIDIVGPSSLITLLESIPAYWQPMIDMMTTRVGDHRTEEGRAFLTERSPLTHVDKIQRPLLIGQGANDPRVKQAESDQIVAAMEAKKIPVTYVLYPDEGHGFARPENRRSFFAVCEAFLAEHLGGAVEPIGNDFEDSTIAVPNGATAVAGVAPALAAGN